MQSDNIQLEIEELKKIELRWANTSKDKNQVRDLISSIKTFNHVFSVKFPNAKKFYRNNSFAEIKITDGLLDLESYTDSKLKNKDDHYFYDGIKNITNGIKKIITYLDNEIDSQ